MIAEPPICMWCKHFRRTGPLACDAFPESIPEEIWYHQDYHIQPFPGDHGIQFELDEERDKTLRLPRYFRRLLRNRVVSR
jgi:hypothetical protein